MIPQLRRPLDVLARRWNALDRWEKLAAVVWTLVITGVCVRGLVSPLAHSVYPIFAGAARNWLAGADVYRLQDELYRYSPLVASLFVPLALLPDRLGGLLWRLLCAGVYLGAFAAWVRVVLPRKLTTGQRGLLFLLLVPLSVGSLNNGQSNPLILGLILAGLTAVVVERWNLAAGCVAVACLFKIYPIAVGLLLALLYPRRFAGRLAAALAVGVALPFLLQRPDYVLGEYVNWVGQLRIDDRQNWPVAFAYRDLRLLFRVWLVPLSGPAYLAIQLVAGAGIAGLCLLARRQGWPQRVVLVSLLGLSCCWMTLLGSATESSTYILLAPTLAWAVLEGFVEQRSRIYRCFLLASFGLFLLTQTAVWFGGWGRQVHALGTHPLAALLLLGCLLTTDLGRFAASGRRTDRPGGRPLTRAA